MDDSKIDFVFKILICGNNKTGKTSVFNRYTSDQFSEEHTPLKEDDKIKVIKYDKYNIKLKLTDLFGTHERFRNPGVSPYRNSDGIIIAYDITDRSSFEDVENWYKDAMFYSKSYDPPSFHLVGLKLDLVELDQDQRKVTYDEAKAIADRLYFTYTEVSSKYNLGIEETIITLTKQIIDTRGLDSNGVGNSTLSIKNDNSNNKHSKNCNLQ